MKAGVKYYSISNSNGNTGYLRKSKRSEAYLLTIVQNGLGQRFEERRRRRPADVFNIIPNTVVQLLMKVDGAIEGRRSHKGMRSR